MFDPGTSYVGGRRTATVAVLLALVLAAGVGVTGPPAEPSEHVSLSVGTPMDGKLVRGEVLPKRGAGYELMPSTRERRARFGVTELIYLIKTAAHRVNRKHRGALLRVGDLSNRQGGEIDHHGSHQNGRDVDLAFYMRDRNGKPTTSDTFVPFDGNGYSTDPPLAYRFDVARNWALIEALITSDRAQVQFVFVADYLKTLLIEHARAARRPLSAIGKAKLLLKQPGKKAHVDHFHVRIYCPADDLPRCRDVGPRWAWVE
jgi:penicillin-insensitive murein endopeptidase